MILFNQSKRLATIGSWLLILNSWEVVTALDMQIDSVDCGENSAIQMDFNVICNKDRLCTFGEEELLEGTFTYNGLEDTGLNGDSTIYLNNKIVMYVSGYQPQHTLMDMVSIPVCNGYLTASEDNEDDCPADGDYFFNTTYEIPAIQSSVVDWAATGWNGEMILALYKNSTISEDGLLGECTMKIHTMVTGSTNGGFGTTPSAKHTLLGVMALLASLLLCLFCCCCMRHNKRTSVNNSPNQGDDEDPKVFARMDNPDCVTA